MQCLLDRGGEANEKKPLLIALTALTITVFFAVVVARGLASPAQDEYSPARHGVPESLADYQVLAVINEENFACLNPGEKRLVLQSSESSATQLLTSVSNEEIIKALEKNNIRDIENWNWSFVGPAVNREETIRLLRTFYLEEMKNGCTQLGGPIAEPTPTR